MPTLVNIFRYLLSPYFIGFPLSLFIEIGVRRIFSGPADGSSLAYDGTAPPGYIIVIAILMSLQLVLGTSVIVALDFLKAGRRGFLVVGFVSATLWVLYSRWRGFGSSTEVLPAEYVMAGVIVAGFNLAFTLKKFQSAPTQSEQNAASDHH